MKNLCAGIDFGTTNTTAAVVSSDMSAQLVPLEKDELTIPSTIFFEEKTGGVFFGRDAINRYMDYDEGRFMRSLKRVLGTSLMNDVTVIKGQNVSFEFIIGHFIKNIKSKLDNFIDQNIENVVMGRPVHFRDDDASGDAMAQKELEKITKSAGFKNVMFQYEPIAAAFAHEINLTEEQLAIVIDIGGGTSDFTVIRLGENLTNKLDRSDDILSNMGVRIGGNDFDKQLSLKTFMPEFGMGTTYDSNGKILPIPNTHFFDLSEWSQVNSLYEHKNMNMVNGCLIYSHSPEKYGRLYEVMQKQLGHMVLSSVEDTKIKLSDNDKVEVSLDFMQSKPLISTSRSEFELSINIHTMKILNSIKECLRLATVNAKDIQLIVLTGGSTEIPYIRDTLCSVFPNAKVSNENKLSSVGLGLAYDASRRFNL